MTSHLPVLCVVVPLLTALLIPLVSRFKRGAGWWISNIPPRTWTVWPRR